ncbi:MAG: ribonucleoside triphosphate reductase [Deltaproteobacteria bacterium]|nr:ribonucleoside triphosphate reductase [Deltaproteobacteria bacterium]
MQDLQNRVEYEAETAGFEGFNSIAKRDGRQVAFNAAKITDAIAAAGRAVDEYDKNVARRLTVRVLTLAHELFPDAAPTVEGIQDIVEEVLLSSPYKKAAKAYLLYREQHARMREIKTAADIALVDQYLGQSDWLIKENSNMAYSLQGLNNYISSEISKAYWLNHIYPPAVRKAHIDGDFHIHDLNLLAVYCVGWDLKDLLMEGFCGATGKVQSAPPNHLQSALGQIVNFFYTLQGEAAGAQALSNFDTLLAPFVRNDHLDFYQVKQALRGFVFNLNVPTRVGFQTPFTNLTLDLKVPSALAHEAVVIGGSLQQQTYADYQHEMNMINRALFEVLSEGDALGRVFTFPIPTVNVTKDFDWDDPDLQSVWTATARYGIPYFANFVNSDLSPDDARSMCCRLRLDTRELLHRGGGLFGSNPLTGSIGVVTLNLPRAAYLSSDKREFFLRLDVLTDLARDSLEMKRKVLERMTDNDLYPYSRFYLRNIKQRFDAYWHNHFSTIGVVGMHEACRRLLGKGIGDESGRKLALQTLEYLRHRLQKYQSETGHFYNLEATPAEGAAHRLARIDRQSLGDRFAACCDSTTYTNSTQLPVDHTDDIFEALDLQDELQSLYTGGTVMHVYCGEAQMNPESVKKFIRMVCQNYRLPYLTLSPTFSICPDHGYLAGEQPTCPICARETEVYSRVVGYLRPIKQWNEGKQDEFRRRTRFAMGELLK